MLGFLIQNDLRSKNASSSSRCIWFENKKINKNIKCEDKIFLLNNLIILQVLFCKFS